MNPVEAAGLLAVAATLDPRMTPPSGTDAEARAKAWAIALDDDMPPTWATRKVIEYYAEADRAVMPADLNKAWRIYRAQKAEAQRTRLMIEERKQQELRAVPMPPEIREKVRRMIHPTEGPNNGE